MVGAALLAFGLPMMWTGRNLPGLPGRGLTSGDTLRLKRAPKAYFRALAGMAISFGLMLVWGGFFFTFAPDRLSSRQSAVVLSVFGVLLVLVICSAAATVVVATKYKLRRWDKP